MAKIKTTPLGRRVMALFLATIMCVSLVQISAFAAGDAAAEQKNAQMADDKMGGTSYYKADGTAGDSNTYDVAISKDIAATGTENLFNVTTKVKYRNTTTSIKNKDAAVVLVIDVSGSMSGCSECGYSKDDHYSNPHSFVDNGYYDWGDWVSSPDGYCDTCGYSKDALIHHAFTQSRLEAAKSAACAFLDGYAAGKAKRYISIVTFSGSANTKKIDDNIWVDVSTPATLTAVKDVINGLKPENSTYTAGGARLARNLFTTTSVNTSVAGISNKSVVMLTDGSPNLCYHEDAKKDLSSTEKIVGYKPNKHRDFDPANDTETFVKDYTMPLYTICYGTADEEVIVGTDHRSQYKESVSAWMNNLVTLTASTETGKNYSANNADELNTAFTNILNSTVSSGTQGTVLTDTLNDADNGPVRFIKFNNKTSQNGANNPTKDTGAIVWDLGKATADSAPEAGFTSYTMSYQVQLDNTVSGFASNKFYTLGAASMTFNDVSSNGTSHTADSPKPAVKGYLGGFSFQKRASGDTGETPIVTFGNSEAAKANAEFTVSGKNNMEQDVSKTAWTNNNQVEFTAIPSGGSYMLAETNVTAPNGKSKQNYFTQNGKTYTVEVAYGHTVVKDGDTVVYNSTPGVTTGSPFIVYNDYTTREVPLTITKRWSDSDKNANRSDSITVQLTKAGDEKAGKADNAISVRLTGERNAAVWTKTVNIPTRDPKTGEDVSYCVSEVKADGYTSTVTSDYKLNAEKTAATAEITNTRTQKTDITVSKKWVTVDSFLPGSLTIGLQRSDKKDAGDTTASVSSSDNWSHTFKNLNQYDGASSYTYSPVEIVADKQYGNGSTVTIDGHNYQVSVNGYTITNMLMQDNTKQVTGTKKWNVADYADKKNLTATFTAIGKVDDTTVADATGSATINSSAGTYTISNLPTYAYRVNGTWQVTASPAAAEVRKITYTVSETSTNPDGIKTTRKDNNFENRLTGTTSVTVNKVWKDSDNQYSTRPDSITFDLYANGEKTDRSETISAKEVTAVKSTEGSEAAKAPEATVSRTWDGVDLTANFTGLDKYDAQGKRISYTVVERGTENGVLTGTNYTVDVSKNTAADGDFAYTVTNTLNGDKTSVTVSKIWLDNLTPETRKAEATVTLKGSDGKSYSHTFKSSDDSHTFSELPVYANGSKVTYTAEEAAVDGYTSNQTNGAEGITFTNVLNQDSTVTVEGKKTWVTNSAVQPDSTTVYLQSNLSGKMETVSGKDGIVLSDKTQSYTFNGLPKYAYEVNGAWTTELPKSGSGSVTAIREIVYQVTDSVDGYTTTGGAASDQYNLTNTFNQQYTSISGSKVWVDGAGKNRPAEIQIALYRSVNGGEAERIDTTTASAATEWKFSFGKDEQNQDTLPLFNSYAKEANITYYVRELNGGKPVDNGAKCGDYKVTYSGNDIINSLSAIDEKTTSVTATKIWKGPAAVDEVKVQLTRTSNDSKDSKFSKKLTLTKNGNWSATASSLPTLDSKGYPYTYSIAEEGVDSADGKDTVTLGGKTYDVLYSEDHLTVTNVIHQETVNPTGEKVWKDTTTTPTSIQVQLYANNVSLGKEYAQTVTADKNGKWAYTFENLPKYNLVDTDNDGVIDTDGREITYTVKEVGEQANSYVSGDQHFSVKYDGMNIENTLVSTDSYTYRVDRIYVNYLDGTQNGTANVGGTPVSAKKNDVASIDAKSYPTQDNKSGYTFVKGVLQVVKTGADTQAEEQKVDAAGKFNVNITDPNVTYVVTLTYEKRDTTPYVPGPGPTPGPTPTPNPPTVITEPTTPTTEIPATETPTTEIPDVETPTTEKPATKPTTPATEIPDDKTPLANTPKTGDALAAWLTAAVASGAGLAWLAISAKKRKEDSAQ